MTTVRSWWFAGRNSLLVTVIALGLVGCVPPASQPTIVETVTTVVTVSEVPPTQDPVLLQARQSVGPPAIEVVELTLDAARRVDYIRHQAPRGEGQEKAIEDTYEVLAFLQDAQGQLAEGVGDLPDDMLPGVVDSAEAMSQSAGGIADNVEEEVTAASAYIRVDAALEEVVAQWDQSGSRPEMEDSFSQLVGQAQEVLDAAQGLQPYPPDCPGLRDNRIRWAEVVVGRTEQLRLTAAEREGLKFDELVASFRPQPFGEDPLEADAATRPCWIEQSALPPAENTLTVRLEELEQSLTK
ncbi:hypothetical protein BH24ACT15_BH24ACT15_28960 [soil metagenome]